MGLNIDTRELTTQAYIRAILPDIKTSDSPIKDLCKALFTGDNELSLTLINRGVSLEAPIGKFRLTALMLAVILDRKEIVEEILSRPCQINAKSHLGLTALHHAAIKGGHRMKMLQAHGSDRLIKDFAYGTPDDLLKLCYEWRKIPKGHVVLEGERLSAEDFKAKTGVTLIDEIAFPPTKYVQNWAESTENHRENSIRRLRSVVEPDCLGLKNMGCAGLGAVALKPLSKRAVIGEYQGLFTGAYTSTYCMQDLDAKDFASLSLTSFIQEGFPNVCPVTGNSANGARRVLFEVADPIEEGKPALIDYGRGHEVKLGIYIEIDKESARKFVNSANFFKSISRSIDPEARFHLMKINYLCSTPVVLTKLICEKVLTRNKLDHLLRVSSCDEDGIYLKYTHAMYASLIEIANEENEFVQSLVSRLHQFVETVEYKMIEITIKYMILHLETLRENVTCFSVDDYWNELIRISSKKANEQ